MKGIKALQSHFTSLSDDLKDFGSVSTFKRTFSQDMDLLEKHITREILHEFDCKTALTKLRSMLENTFNSKLRECLQNYIALETYSVKDTIIVVMENTCSGKENSSSDTAFSKSVKESSLDSKTKDYDSQRTDKYFAEYTGMKVKQFREILLKHMGNVKKYVAERTRHKSLYDIRVNKRQMQTQESMVDLGKALDVGLVVIESSGTESKVQDESSRSGNDTDVDDADIRPIYDEEPMAEVQLTSECNIFAT
ncbi:hypothetical protein Tco_0821226 [Tanacetum coccineum]|uniref:Uncharacterized protein n=1 Tax=Tanacetum coccineum TaxID=301880 RepID=A0ABQ5AET7_9ASTR